MAREIAIRFYSFVFQVIFNLFNLFPQKKKTVFVASFGENVFYTLKEVERQTSDQIVILKTSQCRRSFNLGRNQSELSFEPVHFMSWVRSIYHLATCEKVFIDNYYGFLSIVKFKPNVVCVQLWHAAGAIKQFGLKDPATQTRTNRAHERFKVVYQRFDHVVVGSEKMATIFKNAFGVSDEKILRSGIPRTDFFFDKLEKKQALKTVNEALPHLTNKKMILYAPTYRDDELHLANIQLDLELMREALADDYQLLLRLHPAVTADLSKIPLDFVIDVSTYPHLNHLLLISDLLLTDYSSIPFEYSLLHKPMLFFAYDLKEYSLSSGFWEDYEVNMPGPIVKTTEEVIETIQKNEFDLEEVKSFANKWNTYSTGRSSEQLVNLLYDDAKVK